MTRSTLRKPTPDRNATTNAYSGGSPPRCSHGHDLSDSNSFYLTASGARKCLKCRIAYVEALLAQRNNPAYQQARAKAIADEKARRAAAREERRQQRRAGRQLLLDMRAATKRGQAS